MYLPLLILGWLYVALMMSVAEAMNPAGTVLGAFFTFVLYGALPVALLAYLLSWPARKKSRKAAEEKDQQAPAESFEKPTASDSGIDADGSGEAPTGTVTPVRKEP